MLLILSLNKSFLLRSGMNSSCESLDSIVDWEHGVQDVDGKGSSSTHNLFLLGVCKWVAQQRKQIESSTMFLWHLIVSLCNQIRHFEHHLEPIGNIILLETEEWTSLISSLFLDWISLKSDLLFFLYVDNWCEGYWQISDGLYPTPYFDLCLPQTTSFPGITRLTLFWMSHCSLAFGQFS